MSQKSQIDTAQRSQLPKLIDDGLNNNYGEWKTKSFHILRSLGLWKYIDGPLSIPPTIPALVLPQTHHGTNDNGEVTTVHIQWNQAEYDTAVTNAQPWMEGNYLCLSKIVNATPSVQLHLVEGSDYAKDAWESLRALFQPQNSLRASTIKADIMGYRCHSNMNVSQGYMTCKGTILFSATPTLTP